MNKDTIQVVKIAYMQEKAYNMGYSRFSGMDAVENPDLEGFQCSATYANHVLPKLRAMSGFSDNKRGTFTLENKVAAIEPGCEEDSPAEASVTNSHYVFSELMEYWEKGAYDAMEGKEPYVDR